MTIYIWIIDHVWGQDGWTLAKFFFCEFMDLDFVPVHKHAAILTEQTWSIRDLLYGFREFSLRDTAGSPERPLRLARSGSQSQLAIWVILPACGASHIYN